MNKLGFVNEVGDLANKFASLIFNYTIGHSGYDGVTENKKPIVVANVSVSIQDDALATVDVDIGCADSEHRIRLCRYPSLDKDTDWRIEEDK